ncbi:MULTISPECIES: bifunctional metallophosphatase/5'-nucleotidase [Enterobacteriaceae]|uniref:bifunctional metallophosphatase/5'-nucleotidase n=1 Tax=Enterobacteriaceae TaxID=543 RepID=UPI0015DC75D3|nr:bifunctional UDP-sugar hydrolase/5'-nucleotidase [Klebsiella sp. WP8-S18-ESBL-06]BBT72307.1 multifunctional 2',3'-cyclic-nucleotide 2'-phosphodiesterase/5'-nucleotidase/3'-nucleotidase [Klebsiella sp. WP8-S18-ESBL-06]
MKIKALTAGILLALPFCVCAKNVTIYYTNDLHAHVSPGKIPAVDKARAVGGFANIATLVNDARKESKDVFFFDAGDYFTGPYISTLTKGEAIIDIMNTMPFDAVSVGNHEFDHGVDNMVKQLSKANFPILLGNVFYTNSDKPVWNKPWTIVEKDGIKIGVIGVHQKFAFYDTVAAKAYAGSEARDEGPYIQKGLDELKGKVDIIVLLIHEGTPARQSSYGSKDVARMLQADIDTAKKFEGIDVLITGHAHVGTPEPIKVNNTLVVSTDAYGTDVGKLVLDFNPQTKKIDGYSGKLITVFADEYKPDPKVQAKIDEWNTKLKNITDQIIGSATAPFTRAYGESSPVGNLVLDAMMAKTPDAVAGFQNSGGMRADFPQGNLKYGDIITTFPFNNELVEMDLTGKDLINLMIHATNLTNGVLQVSKNVHVEYDSKKPLGDRLIKFTINNQPIESTKTYRVVTHSFCATGGDGFESFLNGKNVKTISGTTSAESIIDYVKTYSPVKPDLEKRVTDVSSLK